MASNALNKTLNDIRHQILKYPALKKYGELVEEKTHVNVEYFVLGLGVILALSLFNGLGARFISNAIGFLYPMYATIHALETQHKDDDTEWLMYWIVFATFSLVENFIEFVIYWIPFYYPLKVTFLLWCMLPQYKGAAYVYGHVIKPIFLKHESSIDAALNNVKPTSSESNKKVE